MRLYKSVLVGALMCSVGLVVTAGCSDDDEAAPAGAGGGGSGGASGNAGTGGGGSSGRGGSSGSAGTAGTGGGDAAACMPTDSAKAQCKMTGSDSGSCTALTECACNACVCELAACEANANCRGIRACATRTGCCGPADTRCIAAGRPQCSMHPECGPLVTAANMAMNGFAEIVEVSGCVYDATRGGCTNNVCFSDGGGTSDGGGGDSSTTDSGATDSGGGG
jgi:hypothetical protein